MELSHELSFASTMTATPAATSPHGWVRGASPIANHGDMLSRPVCHFGGFLGGLGLPILRRCRSAMNKRATPMAIFTANAASEGAVFGFGGLFPVTRTVRATTMARDNSD